MENLQNTINAITKIVPNNPGLPILENLLLVCNAGGLTGISTNLEITIKLLIRGNTETEGKVCVSAKAFQEVCQVLPRESVVLELEESNLKISSGNFQIHLAILSSEEFPTSPDPDKGTQIKFPADLLKQALEQVVFAASVNSTQVEISSVLLRGKDNTLICVATDRYRLAELRLQGIPLEDFADIILPLRTTVEIIRLLGIIEAKEIVILNVSDFQVWIETPKGKIISRLIEGQYPEYEQIIPKHQTTITQFKKEDFIQAVRAAGIFARDQGGIKLSCVENGIIISSSREASKGKGSSRVLVPAQVNGPAINIAFSYRALLEGMASFSGGEINLGMLSDTQPACFTSVSQVGYSYIIMPLRIE